MTTYRADSPLPLFDQPSIYRPSTRREKLRGMGRFIADENAKRLARNTDPSTSADAAARHIASGNRDTHCAQVLAAVKQLPGRTSAELSLASGIDRVECARRLADLRNQGLVVNGAKRICRAKGGLAVTWEATT